MSGHEGATRVGVELDDDLAIDGVIRPAVAGADVVDPEDREMTLGSHHGAKPAVGCLLIGKRGVRRQPRELAGGRLVIRAARRLQETRRAPNCVLRAHPLPQQRARRSRNLH